MAKKRKIPGLKGHQVKRSLTGFRPRFVGKLPLKIRRLHGMETRLALGPPVGRSRGKGF